MEDYMFRNRCFFVGTIKDIKHFNEGTQKEFISLGMIVPKSRKGFLKTEEKLKKGSMGGSHVQMVVFKDNISIVAGVGVGDVVAVDTYYNSYLDKKRFLRPQFIINSIKVLKASGEEFDEDEILIINDQEESE